MVPVLKGPVRHEINAEWELVSRKTFWSHEAMKLSNPELMTELRKRDLPVTMPLANDGEVPSHPPPSYLQRQSDTWRSDPWRAWAEKILCDWSGKLTLDSGTAHRDTNREVQVCMTSGASLWGLVEGLPLDFVRETSKAEVLNYGLITVRLSIYYS
jgi:hypothetical protein